MKKMKWWLWIVGGWYLLLALVGLGYAAFAPNAYLEIYKSTLPAQYASDPLAVLARVDGDYALTLVWIVLGVMMFAATRDLSKARFFIWAMVWMELGYVIVDVIWILRGFPNIVTFLLIHFLFGVTGFVFLRQVQVESTK